MKAIEFITEVFQDKNIRSNITRSDKNKFITRETIGNRVIEFEAVRRVKDEWDIGFVEINSQQLMPGTYEKTGSGNEIQVFSFVINSLKEFVELYHPEKLIFSSNKSDANRTQLYKKLVNRIKIPGYHLDKIYNMAREDVFYIVRDK